MKKFLIFLMITIAGCSKDKNTFWQVYGAQGNMAPIMTAQMQSNTAGASNFPQVIQFIRKILLRSCWPFIIPVPSTNKRSVAGIASAGFPGRKAWTA